MTQSSSARNRDLEWEGCSNVRDLGGLPTAAGGETRFGAVVRADNVNRLSRVGWEQLVGYGIRTVVDLRFDEERARDPHGERPVPVLHISLFGAHDPAVADRLDTLTRGAPSTSAATTLLYLDALERCRGPMASAVRAVAAAPEGGVLVHCFVGKDRTGIVTALLLSTAGVAADVVARDYARSATRVASLVDTWIASAEDEHERAYRARISAAPEEGMLGVLAGLHERYGDVAGYLAAIGVSAEELDVVRARLVGS
jgi:protein-tyrosine phosphatase